MTRQILITGANRGIGLALTHAFLKKGDMVSALCRQPSEALEDLGVFVVSGIDVTDIESIKAAKISLGAQTFDMIINNAGILNNESLENLDDQALRQIQNQFKVNAMGPLMVSSVFLDRLNKNGKIAMITSRMGSISDNSSGGKYGYRMSKAALNMAGVSMAHDLKEQDIAVGIFHPGWVKTEMTGQTGHVTAEEAADMLVSQIELLSMKTSGYFFHANGDRLPW